MPDRMQAAARDAPDVGVVSRWRSVVADLRRDLAEAGRAPDAAEVLCVSKTQPTSAVEPLLLAGARAFGENRVQEAQTKWPELKRRFPDLRLHLIGPLQTNKVDDALRLFDVIETLDRPRLAERIARRAPADAQPRSFFIEVNTGREPQKGGIAPDEADAFIESCRKDYGLRVEGLMCIPPIGEPAAPHFALLAKIAARHGLARLSMGMSADYRLALQLGATEVRIGTAIFGARG